MDPKFSAILLAAGRGSRMKSRRPKVLHEILGVPMIEVITASVRDAGAADLIVVLGHGAEEVRGCLDDGSARIAIQEKQLGTADALLAALRQQPPAHPQVLVVNGDLPDLDPTLLTSFVADHGKSSSAFSVATARVADPTGMGRIVRDQTGDFISIVEEEQASDTERAIDEVNLGLYVLDAEMVTPVLDEMVAADLSARETAGESYLTRL
ncbi:MAG TPA: bifunctional N-acetylglucosamine-1-phosphate uridyltransferase/glucosamine-1-phosphate acetyltransferase, partial [Planctomycetes bacterium]|nr:bifunctional N-acetylglucosamine-1-phosphate uridyltransferase/glucosamine-1-phosphate acetyltransferase [Planctomycetota bacterium]